MSIANSQICLRSIVLNAWIAVLLVSLSAITACSTAENRLHRVQAKKELVVVTRNSPTTYYEGPDGPTGLEHDLAQAFARFLGVDVRFELVPDRTAMVELVENGGADLAAGLVASNGKNVRYGPAYYEVRPYVVYRVGGRRPIEQRDLIGRHLEVPANNSDHIARLNVLKRNFPALSWREIPDVETEELLQGVWEGLLDLTIADSNELELNRQYYPELQPAFAIDEPQQLAWAFADDNDDSLYRAAADFFEKLRERELARILDRHHGPSERFNYVNAAAFLARIDDTLPAYRDLFMTAGDRYGIDWRLLAAIGYQESYWDPGATSRTGVKGIMMLTHNTSSFLGVTDREDPAQSIDGGARYLRSTMDRLPPGILQPDRTWMALAAYNVGRGHLEDARIITQILGGDPNKWHDVEERLPLLANSTWYKKLKHGYARGNEPVQFVRRIRSYYSALVKFDEEEKARNNPVILKLKAPAL